MLSIVFSVILQCMVIFLFLNETVSTILTFVGTHQQLLLSVSGTLQELSLREWPQIHKTVRSLGSRCADNPYFWVCSSQTVDHCMLPRRRHTVGGQFIHDLSLLPLDQKMVVLVSGRSTDEKAACHTSKPYRLPGLSPWLSDCLQRASGSIGLCLTGCTFLLQYTRSARGYPHNSALYRYWALI